MISIKVGWLIWELCSSDFWHLYCVIKVAKNAGLRRPAFLATVCHSSLCDNDTEGWLIGPAISAMSEVPGAVLILWMICWEHCRTYSCLNEYSQRGHHTPLGTHWSLAIFNFYQSPCNPPVGSYWSVYPHGSSGWCKWLLHWRYLVPTTAGHE